MAKLYLLDRLIPKHICISNVDEALVVPVWWLVVYSLPGEDKQYVGMNVGYELEADKTGTFISVLEGTQKEKFEGYQRKAEIFYKQFKKEFPGVCPGAIPVTSRADLQGQNIYFYFYSEERYNFADFVRYFRSVVPVQFFIYQLGARDMMRYSANAKDHLAACWCGPLGCCSLWKLPSVEMDNIALQSLEWRDIEKLKWRCGKLKCSVVYERELYIEETNKFPKKWAMWKMHWHQCICIWYNIMNGEVVAKTQEWEILRWQKDTFHLDPLVPDHV